MPKLKPQLFQIDFSILAIVLLLTAFGLIMIYNASVIEALRDFQDKYHFVKLQIAWAGIGIFALLFFTFFNYHNLSKISFPLIVLAILLLIAVLLPNVAKEVLGAKRRIDFGPFGIQPAEFAKFAFIIYQASWLSRFNINDVGTKALPFFLILVTVIGLVLAEPDLGTASIIIATLAFVYFASGAPLKHFFVLIPVILVGVTGFILQAPYRINRLLSFLDPSRDPQNSSYHLVQILIALANGGFFGLGLGQSRQKFEYLPEVATDSIFAIIVEELGLIGGLILAVIFFLLIYKGLKIAQYAPDKLGQLLAVGLISWIGLQTFINLAGIVVLIPLTGIPLPFVSYGGSALISNFAAIGVLLNISKYRIIVNK